MWTWWNQDSMNTLYSVSVRREIQIGTGNTETPLLYLRVSQCYLSHSEPCISLLPATQCYLSWSEQPHAVLLGAPYTLFNHKNTPQSHSRTSEERQKAARYYVWKTKTYLFVTGSTSSEFRTSKSRSKRCSNPSWKADFWSLLILFKN